MLLVQFGIAWSLRPIMNDRWELLVENTILWFFWSKPAPKTCLLALTKKLASNAGWKYDNTKALEMKVLVLLKALFLIAQWFNNSCTSWNKFTTVSSKSQKDTNFICIWRQLHIQNRIHLLRFRKESFRAWNMSHVIS